MFQPKYIIVSVIVILLIGGFSCALFQSKQATQTGAEAVNQITEQGAKTEQVKSEAEKNAEAWSAAIKDIKAADSDMDGVKDTEEAKLGTDPNDEDTDHDGLLDGMEVNIYKTDPKNPDTDGDGFKDGPEVMKGFNPNGPGRL